MTTSLGRTSKNQFLVESYRDDQFRRSWTSAFPRRQGPLWVASRRPSGADFFRSSSARTRAAAYPEALAFEVHERHRGAHLAAGAVE